MIVEGKSTEENKDTKVQEAEGLSRRDALEVAIETHKEADAAPKKEEVEAGTAPVKESRKGDNANLSPLRPPSEFTKEEAEDFNNSPRKAQEAALRLHKSRSSTLEEIKREKAEVKQYKELAGLIDPYLKAVGVKKPTEVALKEALGMWQEFNVEDPRQVRLAAAAYLEARGISAPKELTEQGEEKNNSLDENSPLHKRIKQLEDDKAKENEVREVSPLIESFNAFQQITNAAGAPKYPDVDNSEDGLRLASNIGSLVLGKTEFSKQFIARVKNRIPDLTYHQLIEEAYKWEGGQVDDSTATGTQTTQKHIAQSNRAAASKPGRGNPSVGSTAPVKKYSTRREAAAAALAEIREREEA